MSSVEEMLEALGLSEDVANGRDALEACRAMRASMNEQGDEIARLVGELEEARTRREETLSECSRITRLALDRATMAERKLAEAERARDFTPGSKP